jgi:hypothetical protein
MRQLSAILAHVLVSCSIANRSEAIYVRLPHPLIRKRVRLQRRCLPQPSHIKLNLALVSISFIFGRKASFIANSIGFGMPINMAIRA